MESIDIEALEERTEAELARHKRSAAVLLWVCSLMIYSAAAVFALVVSLDEPQAGLTVALTGGVVMLAIQTLGLIISGGALDRSLRAQAAARAMAALLEERRSGKHKKKPVRLEDEAALYPDQIVILGDDGEIERAVRS
jgi:hypothetical protein